MSVRGVIETNEILNSDNVKNKDREILPTFIEMDSVTRRSFLDNLDNCLATPSALRLKSLELNEPCDDIQSIPTFIEMYSVMRRSFLDNLDHCLASPSTLRLKSLELNEPCDNIQSIPTFIGMDFVTRRSFLDTLDNCLASPSVLRLKSLELNEPCDNIQSIPTFIEMYSVMRRSFLDNLDHCLASPSVIRLKSLELNEPCDNIQSIPTFIEMDSVMRRSFLDNLDHCLASPSALRLKSLELNEPCDNIQSIPTFIEMDFVTRRSFLDTLDNCLASPSVIRLKSLELNEPCNDIQSILNQYIDPDSSYESEDSDYSEKSYITMTVEEKINYRNQLEKIYSCILINNLENTLYAESEVSENEIKNGAKEALVSSNFSAFTMIETSETSELKKTVENESSEQETDVNNEIEQSYPVFICDAALSFIFFDVEAAYKSKKLEKASNTKRDNYVGSSVRVSDINRHEFEYMAMPDNNNKCFMENNVSTSIQPVNQTEGWFNRSINKIRRWFYCNK